MSLKAIATATATTKRVPAIAGGKRGDPIANLTTPFAMVPLTPVSLELAQRLGLGTPVELKQTVVYNQGDIKEGDYLTVGAVDYPIKYVGEYEGYPGIDSITRLHIIVEEPKR